MGQNCWHAAAIIPTSRIIQRPTSKSIECCEGNPPKVKDGSKFRGRQQMPLRCCLKLPVEFASNQVYLISSAVSEVGALSIPNFNFSNQLEKEPARS